MNNKDVGRWYVSEIPNLFQLEIVLCYITMAFIIINLSMWEIWYISSNFSHVHTQIIQEMSGHLHLGYTIWSHLRVRCQYPKLSPSRFWKWCFGGNFSGYVQLKWNDPWIFHLFPLPNPTLSPNCRLVMTMKFTRLFILFSAPFCILQCFLKHLFPVLIFNDRFFLFFVPMLCSAINSLQVPSCELHGKQWKKIGGAKFAESAGTLPTRGGLTVYSRVLGCPNHQFWNPMILRTETLWGAWSLWCRGFSRFLWGMFPK